MSNFHMYIDSHSHLYFRKKFPDFEEVLDRAEEAGVKGQILIGCSYKESLDALSFVRTNSERDLFCTLGIHPHNANEWNEEIMQEYEKFIGEDKRIVAIGEIGLDYHYDFHPRELQRKVFVEQLEFALRMDMPVVIHEREAWVDTMNSIKKVGNKKIVLHSFNRGLDEAKEAWAAGYVTSFSGMITYPKNDNLREVVRQVPDDKFFIETDCPFLPPQKYRGKRNEPAYVLEVAREIGNVKKKDLEEVGQLAKRNTEKFFSIG